MFTHRHGTSPTMAEHEELPIPGTAYTTKNTAGEKNEGQEAARKNRQDSCKGRIYIGWPFDQWKKHVVTLGRRERAGELTAITDRKLAKSTT